jgi:hypothetical protein
MIAETDVGPYRPSSMDVKKGRRRKRHCWPLDGHWMAVDSSGAPSFPRGRLLVSATPSGFTADAARARSGVAVVTVSGAVDYLGSGSVPVKARNFGFVASSRVSFCTNARV